MKKNKLIFGIISLALLILAIFCPPILGMSAEGARCLIVFIVFLILSLTNILPSGMASILCTCFMGVIGGFTGMGAAFKSVSVSLMAFCMGTLAITVALKCCCLRNAGQHGLWYLQNSGRNRKWREKLR